MKHLSRTHSLLITALVRAGLLAKPQIARCWFHQGTSAPLNADFPAREKP